MWIELGITPYKTMMDNVDTFLDNFDYFVGIWVKFDILGRKLVKKGDKFQDIGVNEQKYNVDKM